MVHFPQISVDKQACKQTNYSPNQEDATQVNFITYFPTRTKQKQSKIKNSEHKGSNNMFSFLK